MASLAHPLPKQGIEFEIKYGMIKNSHVKTDLWKADLMNEIICKTSGHSKPGALTKTCEARQAMVATAFPEATQAALKILSTGGNAVDAAVAAAWALSVCEPAGSGLGGQSNLLIRTPEGELVYLDGHSAAPAAVSLKTVSARQQKAGYRATTIPSTVATLAAAHQRFGGLEMGNLIEPAILLARDGFTVTALQRRQANWSLNRLPAGAERFGLLSRNRWVRHEGLFMPQTRLSRTLTRLQELGTDDFYHGNIARRMAKDMRAYGGLLSAKDLATLEAPVVREPISIRYRDFEIISTPPPGGGLELLLALRLLENLLKAPAAASENDWYEAIALAIYAAFSEREKHPVHPDEFTPSMRNWMFSNARRDEILHKLRPNRPLHFKDDGEEEPGETTHLCVMDSHGMIVSLTQSIQSLFGARVMDRKLGFVYNNYLSTCPRYPHPYQLGSRCLPQSNASPTLVMKNGSPVMVLGAAGSRRIVSSILQIISRVIDHGYSLPQALAAPRIHALLSGNVWIEKPALTENLHSRLAASFRKIVVRRKHSFTLAGAQAIAIQPNNQLPLTGASDPRRDGATGGF